ncbi:SPOR domain-containing protein [Sphingopyxis lindanitolerans]|uniref:SPOR domain-containing protein n=1 Tax=Sphingopyxis lindanitolerans TaxID=2054227 RepID=UPI001F5B550D|nr:SPOR domain-containing protein [Sphingopyxis lindanitolerans]
MRRLSAAAGLLLLTSVVAVPAFAIQAATPDAATKAAMDKRTAARTLLSSALGRLAANSNDAAALLDAGRASIDLEDYRAATGFLTRAEQASPRDGAVKAALGSAMVHMESPTRALDYFGEAQLLGAPERLFLADRGLARDLLGQQDAAQRDYQLALSIAPNEEVTRRYALSLGISGEADRAVGLLTPQLRAQERAAWRLRAMILAMNGRDAEATEIVNATMPPALAQNILPYLTQMDRLNPAQQAAAAHFGRFPTGQLGPRRKPVQVAAATPPPSPPLPATEAGKRSQRSRPPISASPKPEPKPAPKPAPAASSTPRPSAAVEPRPLAVPPAPIPSNAPSVAPIGTNPAQSSTPVGPGFSIADVGRPASAASAEPMTPPPSIAPAGSKVAPDAPLASLAAIASSIEIPPEELAQADNAIGADMLAKLREDKKRADAAEEAKREKEEAAAKAKAEADAKAKAEAAEKKANPARVWVQVATGANAKALAFDYGRFAKKNPALFKGKSAATTEWGQTRRLLVGPFKDHKAAQDWLADYKKAGGDAFLFNSEAGQDVDPVQ